MPVGLSPTWNVKTGSIGNLPTCDTLFSSKAVAFSVITGTVWKDNPAYVPIYSGGIEENGNRLTDDNALSSGFTRWISPSIMKKCSMFIKGNGITSTVGFNTPFRVYLGEDGPVASDGEFSGPPKKKQLLFRIPLTDDPLYKIKWFADDLNIEMFSGHSYGYIFELDGEPTLPTSQTLAVVLAAPIYFGAAGA